MEDKHKRRNRNRRYMINRTAIQQWSEHAPSYKQFVNNMQEKMADPEFTNDIQSLLRPGISFNACDAYPLIYETFIDRMEGKRD